MHLLLVSIVTLVRSVHWNLPPLSTRLQQATEHVADVGAKALELSVSLAPREEQMVVSKPMLRKAVLSTGALRTAASNERTKQTYLACGDRHVRKLLMPAIQLCGPTFCDYVYVSKVICLTAHHVPILRSRWVKTVLDIHEHRRRGSVFDTTLTLVAQAPNLNGGVVAVCFNHVVILLCVAASKISILIPDQRCMSASKSHSSRPGDQTVHCILTST